MTRVLLVAGLMSVVSAQAQAPGPVQIQNGRIETRAGAAIDREIAAASAPGSTEPVWIAWRTPMLAGDRDMCGWYSDRLGTVRGIRHDPPRVLISPTYTGCPATVAIENMIREALDNAGFEDVHVERVLFPPWTTDWITPRGRERLHAYGIAPPSLSATAECPQCGSADTVEVSRFGATPCKAQWRCNSCLEPFERFKCH